MRTKHLISTCTLLFVGIAVLTATNYYSNGSRTWDSSGFPNPIPSTDTVFIIGSDVVSLNHNLSINGVLVIEASATIDGAKKERFSAMDESKISIDFNQMDRIERIDRIGVIYRDSEPYFSRAHVPRMT